MAFPNKTEQKLKAHPGDSVIHFGQVEVGDRITFTTADNGYGGTGGDITRTGTVIRKTEKIVDLHVGGGIHVFERGKSRVKGAAARLTRNNWHTHSPRRANKEN